MITEVGRWPASIPVIALVFSLSACTTGMGAAVDSARQLISKPNQTAATPLDPKFAYLRVTRDSHVGLLWRGNLEPSTQGQVEVYYGSGGEIVRLRGGRVVGALGLNTEWRRVEVAPTDWGAIAKAGEPSSFVRVRDVMPGYRAGVRDELRLRVIPAPARTALQRLDPQALTWFEETVQPPSAGLFSGLSSDTLPPAKYAVDLSDGKALVVYSEQCLSPDFCFTWQRWSAGMQQAATPAATR
jgi:hypothetical protein